MQKIKNVFDVGTTSFRKNALSVAEAGLRAIDTRRGIEKAIEWNGSDLLIKGMPWRSDKGKIFFVGVGKCATEAAIAIEQILSDKLDSGIVLDICDPYLFSNKIRFIGCTHPLPSSKNVSAAGEVVNFLKRVRENDLVIFVISGGGSTILCLPNSKDCGEEKTIMKRLIAVGATISEINTVRKHLSLLRGGQLLKYSYPARSVSLIFSDVPGNDLGFVASGPTVFDETTVKDAKKILDKYEIWEDCTTLGCGLLETTKDKKYFEKATNVLAVSNMLALKAMHDEAKRLGFEARIVTDRFEGEAREIGQNIVEDINRSPHNSVLLYGGESTVTIDHVGRGGRNCELALSALRFLGNNEGVVALASDGRDNGVYAGAIADKEGKEKADDLKLDIKQYLANHDSALFFEKTGDYLMSGYTGSNVSDLIIAMKC